MRGRAPSIRKGAPHGFEARAVADVPGIAPGTEWLVEVLIGAGPRDRETPQGAPELTVGGAVGAVVAGRFRGVAADRGDVGGALGAAGQGARRVGRLVGRSGLRGGKAWATP
ncbi:hypothetical protein ACFWPQ_24105 [Streptomyces sp. NPDC058464]|uniref:hypothetical protein n=1 Tax=Streptomyces sp. NPDC058464 TaxID=3346511 RepID=UPI0036695AF9